jgi:hypothetical protein
MIILGIIQFILDAKGVETKQPDDAVMQRLGA